jgi:hypothetical protein
LAKRRAEREAKKIAEAKSARAAAKAAEEEALQNAIAETERRRLMLEAAMNNPSSGW